MASRRRAAWPFARTAWRFLFGVKEPHIVGPKRRRSRRRRDIMTVKITPNDRGNPPGKLADAEVHFSDGPLEGLKLIGFSIWEQKRGGGRNVTFPARQYNVNGERRSFALLRPIVDQSRRGRRRLSHRGGG